MQRKTAILMVLLSLVPAAAHAGDPGSAGVPFLRVGMGARAAAMGDAYAAIAEDASTVYWNPGAMPAVLGTHVSLTHTEYFLSMRLEHAAVTHETKWGTFGFSFTGLYMDDMERYDEVASALPVGYFGAYDASFAVAYGRYLFPNVAVGLSVKPIWERIDELSADGIAVDAGIFHVSRVRGLNLAAVVGNVGPPMKFVEEEFALPRYVRVGGSYEREITSLEGRLLLAFDLMFPNDDDMRQHIGAEYAYRRMVALRAGYKGGFDSQGATFGLGVMWRNLDVDYAFLPVSNDIGDTHRMGIGLSF